MIALTPRALLMKWKVLALDCFLVAILLVVLLQPDPEETSNDNNRLAILPDFTFQALPFTDLSVCGVWSDSSQWTVGGLNSPRSVTIDTRCEPHTTYTGSELSVLVNPANASISSSTEPLVTVLGGYSLKLTNVSSLSRMVVIRGGLLFESGAMLVVTLAAPSWPNLSILSLIQYKTLTAAPCQVPHIASISDCPSGYACTFQATDFNSTCTLALKVASTQSGYVSANYYTLKLDLDCSTYSTDLFISSVTQAMNLTSSAAIQVYPFQCGSVFQPFRCNGQSEDSADTLCEAVCTEALRSGSALNKNLKAVEAFTDTMFVNHGGQPGSSSSNPALFGLLALIVLPFLICCGVWLWKRSQRPASEHAPAVEPRFGPGENPVFKDMPTGAAGGGGGQYRNEYLTPLPSASATPQGTGGAGPVTGTVVGAGGVHRV